MQGNFNINGEFHITSFSAYGIYFSSIGGVVQIGGTFDIESKSAENDAGVY
jgi:hypothetical protein